MRASSLLFAVAGALALTACVEDTHTMTGYAPDTVYHAQIQACMHGQDCHPLCIGVFGLDDSQIDRVAIIKRDQYGAKFACRFFGAADNGDLGFIDDGFDWGDDGGFDYDDGGDDGDYGDDGGYDDGGDSGDDDGGYDDGGDSGDDGGDTGDDGGDSGGDDGSELRAPKPNHTTTLTRK